MKISCCTAMDSASLLHPQQSLSSSSGFLREERFRLRANRGELLVRISSALQCEDGGGGGSGGKGEGSANVDNVELNFEDNKDTDNSVTIFYHHGSMATMDMYNSIIDQFRGKFKIVTYDALGCGNSDKPLSPLELYASHDMFEDFCEVFLKYATKRVILVGHSFGTTQVARMCNRIKSADSSTYHREFKGYNVLAAVLLGSAFTVPDGGNPIFKLPVFILNCFRQKMSDAFLEKGLSPNCSPAVRQLCIQNSGKNDMTIVKAFYQQFRWATLSDWESLLAINTLVVHGDDDKILLPDNAERLVSFLKEKRNSSSQFKYATIVDCAHQIMMEKPDELRAIIAEFVAKIGI